MCPDKSILSAYFDGEVGLQWSGEISKHLETCKDCSNYINTLKDQEALLHSLPDPDFEESLARVKTRIRERHTVSGTTRFWQKKISLPAAAAAAVLVASVTLGTNVFTMNRNNKTLMSKLGYNNIANGKANMPGDKIDEIFSMMEASLSDEFSSNSIVELPSDINLIFNGESQLVRSAGFNGSSSP